MDSPAKNTIDLDELERRLATSEAVAKEVGDNEGTHAYCSWHGRADGLRYALQVIAEMRGVGLPVPEIDQD